MATLIKRHHVIAQAVFLRRFFRNVIDFGIARCAGFRHTQVWFDGGHHPRGDIFNTHQLVQFQIRRLNFFVARRRVKAVFDVILFRRTDLLKHIGSNVMIRHHQAVRGNERARSTTVESHRGKLHFPEPRVGDFEAVFFLNFRARNIVEGPHALVRASGELQRL